MARATYPRLGEQPDPTRPQIHPRALAIIEKHGVIVAPGRDAGFAPNFRGVPLDVWQNMYAHHRADFNELDSILESDFPTFAALLLKLAPKGGGLVVPFIFNNSQRYFWDRMARRMKAQQPLFFCVLKARQLGITTFMSAWQYWQLWRQSHIQTLMLGHNDKLGHRIMTTMRVFHDELPDVGDFKPRLRQDTATKKARVPKEEIYLTERGAQSWNSWGIVGSAKNVDQRGFQGSHFTGSEAAFWPKLNDLKDALLPQLPPPGSPAYLQCSVIFESSPKGQNEFYDLYQLASDPSTDWEAVFLSWLLQDDEYVMAEPPPGWKFDDEWKDKFKTFAAERKRQDGKPFYMEQLFWYAHTLLNKYDSTEEPMDVEYATDDETCFMLSKNVLFAHEQKYLHRCVVRAEEQAPRLLREAGLPPGPLFYARMQYDEMASPFRNHRYALRVPILEPLTPRKNHMPPLTIWEPAKSGHYYVIGADASGGNNGRDGACGEVVCVTCGQQAAELWGHIAPEEFSDELVHLGSYYNNALLFPEINYMGSTVLKRVMNGWGYANVGREEKWDEVGLKKHKYGFSTTPNSKPNLISNMVWMIKAHHLAISGRELLRELSVFKYRGYESDDDEAFTPHRARDDRVIALALALMAIRQSPKLSTEMQGHRHALPTAVDLGLSRVGMRAPQVERLPDDFPEDLKNLLAGRPGLRGIPVNPLRGY